MTTRTSMSTATSQAPSMPGALHMLREGHVGTRSLSQARQPPQPLLSHVCSQLADFAPTHRTCHTDGEVLSRPSYRLRTELLGQRYRSSGTTIGPSRHRTSTSDGGLRIAVRVDGNTHTDPHVGPWNMVGVSVSRSSSISNRSSPVSCEQSRLHGGHNDQRATPLHVPPFVRTRRVALRPQRAIQTLAGLVRPDGYGVACDWI